MRDLFGSGSTTPADTPRNGDFARYVEELVERQARTLAGGQRMAPVPPAPVVVVQTPIGTPGPPTRKPQAPAHKVELKSWGDTQETWGRSGSPPMPGGRRLPIPPFWIYVAVFVAIGAFFFGWLMAIPPLVTLALLGFALHRVLKHFGGLGGPGRPRPPQRK